MGPRREVSVVVPSHDRPERLRRLLDALEEQDVDSALWDVVVVHDSAGEETDRVLAGHRLAASGRLRHERLPAGTGRPGRQRDVGWRMATGASIAFVDDDCRPDPGWLRHLLAVARDHPRAIVQGRVVPDPFEVEHLLAPHHRTLRIDPPGPFAQTANILYPRAALEAVDGFAPTGGLTAGEDTDLALRVRARGWAYVGAPEAVVFHAVHRLDLAQAVHGAAKWADLAYVVRQHPELRRHLHLGFLWRAEHGWLLLGLLGTAASRRRGGVLAWLPYLTARLGPPTSPGEHLRRARRLPGAFIVDVAELVACVRGSLRHRTLFL